jgi:F0F1-type ATP synthase assembly protein I
VKNRQRLVSFSPLGGPLGFCVSKRRLVGFVAIVPCRYTIADLRDVIEALRAADSKTAHRSYHTCADLPCCMLSGGGQPAPDGMNEPSSDQSALAKAIAIAHAILSAALQMALPPALGYWLDQRWGTNALMTIIGAVLGLVVGMYSLIRTTRGLESEGRVDRPHDTK